MSEHTHSAEALKACADTLNKRQKAIFYHLFYSGPATDRDVKEKLGYSDMNQVRPRITELLKAGLAVEISETTCPTTGQTVRVVAAVKPTTQTDLTYADPESTNARN